MATVVNKPLMQHADIELLADGKAFFYIDAVSVGDNWIKLWVPITEEHEKQVAPLLSSSEFSIQFKHPDVQSEVLTRTVKNVELRYRQILSAAGPWVACEELCFAQPSAEVPIEPSHSLLRQTITLAVRAGIQAYLKEKP